jgi:hypothetical protein
MALGNSADFTHYYMMKNVWECGRVGESLGLIWILPYSHTPVLPFLFSREGFHMTSQGFGIPGTNGNVFCDGGLQRRQRGCAVRRRLLHHGRWERIGKHWQVGGRGRAAYHRADDQRPTAHTRMISGTSSSRMRS